MGINANVVVKQTTRHGLHLSQLSITGHDATNDTVRLLCAAISMLSRTVMHTIAAKETCVVQMDAPRPGTVALAVQAIPPHLNGWFAGVTSIALQGLHDLSIEFPEQFLLKISDSDGNAISIAQ